VRVGFVGAETFVARRGAPMILDAVHDGLLVQARDLSGQGTGRWVTNPDLKRPAGFLRWLVDQLVREAR
jgi:hypothetical protein